MPKKPEACPAEDGTEETLTASELKALLNSLTDEARTAWRLAGTAKNNLKVARAECVRAMCWAAKTLVDAGVTHAEAGKLLGVSRQRVYQLIKDSASLSERLER